MKVLQTVAALAMFCSVLLGLGQPQDATASSTVDAKYCVVANPAISAKFADEESARQEVRQLFLRNASEWSSKQEAKPFSPSGGEPMHAAFLTGVLQMSEAELARHWITMKNKHGIAPPKEVSSSKMMLKYVGRFEGGFGVVAKEDAEGADLRVLFSF